MRLAIDCRMSGKSGIGAYLDNTLPTLIEDVCLAPRGAVVLLGLPQEKFDEFKGRKIRGLEKCERVPCGIKIFSVRETLFFPRGILEKINSCDAYLSPYCNVPGNISGGIRIPIFCTIHDIVFLDMRLAGWAGTFARRMFYMRAVRRSAGIFTVSNFSKDRIRNRLRCKKEITVAYNGVPDLDGGSEETTARREKTDTIIFVGNIKKHKGLETLIEAFGKFRAECMAETLPEGSAPPRLLIVGSRDNFRTKDTALERAISKSEESGIEFTGFVPNSELRRLMEQARILVQPSLYEGFGIPPLQALYCGTRAVISDIDAFKEIYAALPVTFFRAGDADDLARKMREAYLDRSPLPEFERLYSYEKSARIILRKIQEKTEGVER